MSKFLCKYVNCDRPAVIIIMFNEMEYPLCRRHWNKLEDVLTKISLKRGEASLNSIKVRKERGRIRFIVSREKKSK
ncbi:MAG: hypothetical protein DRJ45_05260 [Thermoprotei archaeon]|nr:MAG: hypothetical protein DRJ45_05260 [Thermoprotei archaeon]